MCISKVEHIPTTLMTHLRVTTKLRQKLKARRMRAKQPIPFTRDILIKRQQNYRSKRLILSRKSRRRQRLPHTPQSTPIALPSLDHERRRILRISKSHQRRSINRPLQTRRRRLAALTAELARIQRGQIVQMPCVFGIRFDSVLIEEVAQRTLVPAGISGRVQRQRRLSMVFRMGCCVPPARNGQ
jgi:hypothetical protein